MPKFKEYCCPTCDSNFSVKHDMDPNHYHVQHCAFCGAELEDDFIFSDEIDEEES